MTKQSKCITNAWSNLSAGSGGKVLTQVTLGMSGVCKTEGKRNSA